MKLFKCIVDAIYNHLGQEKKSLGDELDNHVKEGAKDDDLNLIEIENAIKTALVNSLLLFKGNSDSASRLDLKVFILDGIIYNGLGLNQNSALFINSIKNTIWVELGIEFKSIHVFDQKYEGERQCTKVKDEKLPYLFYAVEDIQKFGKISALKNSGSILGGYVELQPNPGTTYNIGRGRRVRTSTGAMRFNAIAIDDDEKCEEYKNNKYVSSCHAHISYIPNNGYVLYVDKGGSKVEGNRTRILRNNLTSPIDLGSDIKNPVPLEVGDIIELGKHVLLEFTY